MSSAFADLREGEWKHGRASPNVECDIAGLQVSILRIF